MANSYFYSNTAQQTTLVGSISSGGTTLQVAATTGFPPTIPYVLAVDYGAATEELVKVTGVAGTTLTVTRGFGSTSAQSHSVGAIVRHVINAVDLTDFRTHEAATAAVHGVTGTLVGTGDTQTLTNKTLSGGAITGTFTGTPTFSGAVGLAGGGSMAGTFSGNPTFSGQPTFTGFVQINGNVLQVRNASATTNSMGGGVTADAVNRWTIRSDGQLTWGDGTNSRDTNLFRDGVSLLRTNDNFTVDQRLTCNDLTVANDATIHVLDVDTLTAGSTTITSNGLLAASAGWSVSSLTTGVLKAGIVTANLNLTRTGGAITTNVNGTLSTGIVQMGTINATYRPDGDLGVMYVHVGNSAGAGTARITPATGAVELVKWQVNQTIETGHIMSITVTYSL